MWWVPAHTKAQTTASGKKNPPTSVPALIAAILTLGATPTMPCPLDAAAMVPAVGGPRAVPIPAERRAAGRMEKEKGPPPPATSPRLPNARGTLGGAPTVGVVA